MKCRGSIKIVDWAGIERFEEVSFETTDDAEEFLSEYIEHTYPDTIDNDKRYHEERGEYNIYET